MKRWQMKNDWNFDSFSKFVKSWLKFINEKGSISNFAFLRFLLVSQPFTLIKVLFARHKVIYFAHMLTAYKNSIP